MKKKKPAGPRRSSPPHGATRTKRMDPAVFALALSRLKPSREKSYEAARVVLVEGRNVTQASNMLDVSRAAIYLAMARIEGAFKDLGVCPYCGQKMPPV